MQAYALRLVAAAAVVISGVAHARAASRVTCLEVPADREWQATGVELQEGDAVCVRARALWTHGQEADNIVPFYGAQGYIFKNTSSQPIVRFPFARVGALIGKIGDTGLAFPIEDGLCFVVARTPGDLTDLPGELLLSMNDVSGTFDNNDGASRVAITVGRGGRTPFRITVAHLAEQLSHSSCLRN